jgi:hypothetical protein
MLKREKLTGRVRGKPRIFGRTLTMQVEVLIETARHVDLLSWGPPPGTTDLDAWKRRDALRTEAGWRPLETIWRDATWRDLPTLSALQNITDDRPAVRSI